MTAPVTDEALLRTRGWKEVAPGMWCPSDLRGYSAMRTTLALAKAAETLRRCDGDDARLYGSVTYRATAEQTKSPILAACNGTTLERDVIAKLAERVDVLGTELFRALEKQAPATIVCPFTTAEIGELITSVRGRSAFDGDGDLLRKLRVLRGEP